jgi:hypothetical protein
MSHVYGSISISFTDVSSSIIKGIVAFDPDNVNQNVCPFTGVPVMMIDGAGHQTVVTSASDGSYNFTVSQGEEVEIFIPEFQGHTWRNSLPDFGSKWTLVYATGSFGSYDLGKDATNALFNQNLVFYRVCNDCPDVSKLIFYKRISPIPAGFSVYDQMVNTWTSNNNVLNNDFKLYGSLTNFTSDYGAWSYCDYNDPGIAFPRNCGPTAAISLVWYSKTHPLTRRNIEFYVASSYAIKSPPNKYFLSKLPSEEWKQVFSKGVDISSVDIGASATDILFSKSRIFYRSCSNCDPDHQTIFYITNS